LLSSPDLWTQFVSFTLWQPDKDSHEFKGKLTPETSKEDKQIVGRMALGNNAKNANHCAGQPHECCRAAGNPSSTNSIRDKDNNYDGGNIDR
jgi:hypothetical protein